MFEPAPRNRLSRLVDELRDDQEVQAVDVSGELEGRPRSPPRDSLVTKCPSKFTKDEEST